MKEKKVDESFLSKIFSGDTKKIETLQHSREIKQTKGQTLCGDLDIYINSEGLWFHQGTPIGRKELIKLFSSVLTIDNNGKYWLSTPSEKGEIEVEDVPFLAVEMTAVGKNEDCILKFRTNVDDEVIADATHPIRVEVDEKTLEPSPYVLVRNGLEARLTRSVYYQMVEMGSEMTLETSYKQDTSKEKVFGVWSKGQFFQIGKIEP